MTVALVPTVEVHRWWDTVLPLLSPAIDLTDGRWDSTSVYRYLVNGQAQLWLVWDGELVSAAVVTQLIRYPAGKLLLAVLFCGGSGLKEFLQPLAFQLEEFALRCGASSVELQGRPGWFRCLAPFGVKQNGTQLLEIAIDGGRRWNFGTESDHQSGGQQPEPTSMAERGLSAGSE